MAYSRTMMRENVKVIESIEAERQAPARYSFGPPSINLGGKAA